MSKNNKKAFTIIEVVLVLAIAGLIFLMVFIALPALQRSQRDSQRRSDVTKVFAQIQAYQTNNRNQVPDQTRINQNFLRDYLKGGSGSTEFTEPKTGRPYEFSVNPPAETDYHIMQYRTSAKCDGEDLVSITNAPRSVAVRVKLEGAGFLCQDNQ